MKLFLIEAAEIFIGTDDKSPDEYFYVFADNMEAAQKKIYDYLCEHYDFLKFSP